MYLKRYIPALFAFSNAPNMYIFEIERVKKVNYNKKKELQNLYRLIATNCNHQGDIEGSHILIIII